MRARRSGFGGGGEVRRGRLRGRRRGGWCSALFGVEIGMVRMEGNYILWIAR
jgi:hypothetical protein